jgi:hypothetical protein
MSSRASTWISLGSLGLAVALAAGCEGSSSKGDGSVSNRPDASPVGDVFMPPVKDGGAGTLDLIQRPPPPPPDINPAAVKILPQGAELLGGITVGCSYGMGTVGARWCAFARRGDTLGKLELWVMNMSKVPGVKCESANPTNPDCMRLTTNLFNAQPQAGPRHPTAHRWYGDTFIYHADPKSTASQAYVGPIYAWSPGWPAPKKISATDTAFRCVGHSRAPLALCIENLSSADAPPLTFDLYAGKIDGTNTVKKIARILPTHPTAMTSQWGAGFTADGKYFAYSSATAAANAGGEQTPETLYYQETEKLGTVAPMQVGEPGVSSWDISPDNKKWFYMRDYNYSDMTPSGSLYMADFPAGTNPTKIASSLVASGSKGGVAAYDLVINKEMGLAWVAFMQAYDGTTGNFRILKNPVGNLEDPMNVVKILDGSPILPSNSPDLKHAWYFINRATGMTPTTDSRVLHYDGTAACTLAVTPNSTIFGAPFFDNSSLALWVDNYDPDSDTGEGMVASPTDCMSKKKRFAMKVDYWFTKGDDQLVYTDEVDESRSQLKIAKVVNGELGNGELIQKGIDRFFQLLPQQEGAIFRIDSTSEAVNGIYYYKIGGTTTPTTDGGAPADGAAPVDAPKG